MSVFGRTLRLPAAGNETFFLWGPRQTGKSTLLRQAYGDQMWIDLLHTDEYRTFLQAPQILRERLQAAPSIKQVVIDEIQRVPALLDEVHWLIENAGAKFALCGSSARKLRRGHANLLGGRALRYELNGITASEVGQHFELQRMLNHGTLPSVYLSDSPKRRLQAYVSDYLREEIAAEGLVRNLPSFSEFLDVAALSDGEQVNVASIARDCAVSSPTAKAYFDILVDTMLGRWLPAYRKRPKRRVALLPKFYFSDVGVVNRLAKRGTLEPGGQLFGKAFENWVHHELVCHNAYGSNDHELAYWRLASGIEVDFIVDDNVAIEAKASRRIDDRDLKALRELSVEHEGVKRRFVVCLETKARRTSDGIDIMPYGEFVTQLRANAIF